MALKHIGIYGNKLQINIGHKNISLKNSSVIAITRIISYPH